ncbi:S8 family serine peptidase [Mycoplasmopsis opalescens]|uniref:S8 family serine peptidase n=1 Tax=Mycoplasmopsis opalescens TaxID=114886 RepID=UPI0004A6EBCF|nr:S8 family serine peptidase [Mycoplasmopsis opalescens]
MKKLLLQKVFYGMIPLSPIFLTSAFINNWNTENSDSPNNPNSELLYKNVSHVYDEALKPIGVLGFKKWLLENNGGSYKRVKVGIIDNEHVDFGQIIQPKNSNLKYKTFSGTNEDFSERTEHSTKVASFIGGVSGINPYAELYSFGKTKDMDDLIKKLNWAVQEGVKVINISMGPDLSFLKDILNWIDEFKKDENTEHLIKIYQHLSTNWWPYSSKMGSIIDEYSYKYGIIFVGASGNEYDEYEQIFEKIRELHKIHPENNLLEKIYNLFLSSKAFLPTYKNTSFNMISVGAITPHFQLNSIINMPTHFKFTPDFNFISAINGFNITWKNKELEKPDIYKRNPIGTSFTSPIITGLISLLISTYHSKVDWEIDTSDIKSIFALNSVYAKNYTGVSKIFTDEMDKYNRGGKKRLTGYGMPNWVKIRKFFENKNKKNKWSSIDFEENYYGDNLQTKVLKDFIDIQPQSRYRLALSWMQSGWNPKYYFSDFGSQTPEQLEWFFKLSSDYSLDLKGQNISRWADIPFGNHEFIHQINTSDTNIKYDLYIGYKKDTQDFKSIGSKNINKRKLKLYYKEGD